ncbi:hypothetical protein AX16_000058 [Volvariella volvacea WC 439]|nr:hypothetical protein AX16_000058 [Volvariella volvacea WC 439]
MEKFKACEKEMKTKAFSKEGLIQATKLDPKEQEKEEATQWLQTQVEELQMQVEQSEAEIEGLQGAGKKRNKGTATTAGRLEELEALNERRKWHISRLEIVLRLLNNGSMSPEKVFGLKDDVQYFVESNTEEGFDEDEGIYDDLNLDEEEEKFGLGNNDDPSSESSDEASEDLPPRTPNKKGQDKQDEESVTSSRRDESPIMKKASISLQGIRKLSVVESKPPPNPNFAQQPMASVVKQGPRPPAQLPPIRYAAVAAQPSTHTASQTSTPSITAPASSTPAPAPPTPAAVAVQPHPPTVQSTAPSIPPSTPQVSAASTHLDQTSSPSLTHPSVTSPILSSAASQQPDGSFYSGRESPTLSEAVPGSIGGPVATSSPPAASRKADSEPSSQLLTQTNGPTPQTQVNGNANATAPQTQPAQVAPSPLPQQIQYPSGTVGVSAASSPQLDTIQLQLQPQQPQFPPGVKVPLQSTELRGPSPSVLPLHQTTVGGQRPNSAPQQQQARSIPANAFPGSLQDLVVSFENVKQKASLRMNNLDQVHKMLEGGYSSIPQPQDAEISRPKFYAPRQPFQTAQYYPQQPLPLLSTPAFFSQLDLETLFYVFYFQPGTYQQYLAAKELKRQSWRFHVKYLTWFQRHSEPQAITEEYEQGVYVYFDWEGSWCQRKKSDFRFEYRYLSED